MPSGSERSQTDLAQYTVRVVIAVSVTIGIVTLLVLMWLAVDVLFLGFAGILLAVLLRGVGNWLAGHSALTGGWSVAVVILAAAALLAAAFWFAASPVIAQFDTLAEMLPLAAHSVEQHLRYYEFGDWLVEQAYSIDWLSRRIDVLGRMTGALSTVFGTLVNLVIIAFLGLYLAFQPAIYIEGAIRLFPVAVRPRVREVLYEIGRTLQWWLIGILFSMTVTGLLSGIGLRLLGIPFALALGVMAALLSFVPYLGALLSAIPAMLIAMIHGPQYAIYVALLYFFIHMVEGYLLNPVVQQYAVALPAALLLFAQIMLGILTGGLGVVLAAPIAATVLVAVKMIYIQDILGDPNVMCRHHSCGSETSSQEKET